MGILAGVGKFILIIALIIGIILTPWRIMFFIIVIGGFGSFIMYELNRRSNYDG